MTALARRAGALAAAIAVLALAGCGGAPTAAPPPQAKVLDTATGGIANACGRSYAVTEFDGDHHRYLAPLELSAGSSARQLASVFHRNQGWRYRGESVRDAVAEGIAYLRRCGLPNAAELLSRLTR